jgi:hypothetical protein
VRFDFRPLLPERRVELSADLQRELGQPTVSIKDALALVARRRNIGPESAEAVFREACISGKVSSRHIRAFTNGRGERRIAFAKVLAEAWREPSTINIETNSLFSSKHGTFERLLINETELTVWLSRRRRGPAAGALARFAAADRALFGDIERTVRERNISLTEAVRDLDYKGKVKGRGTAESRIRRVTRFYKKERQQNMR